MKFLICTTFPNQTRVFDALASIKGIGRTLSLQLCDEVGITPALRLKWCTQKNIDKLNYLVSDSFLINDELVNAEQKAKARLRSISAYRSFRYTLGLPCRGQRTSTNARNSRKLSASISPERENQRRRNNIRDPSSSARTRAGTR
jgi:small subunit ribosomal protein S13